MNSKKILYKISWTQTYPGWNNFVDNNIESLLKYSDFSEAQQVIKRFMK